MSETPKSHPVEDVHQTLSYLRDDVQYMKQDLREFRQEMREDKRELRQEIADVNKGLSDDIRTTNQRMDTMHQSLLDTIQKNDQTQSQRTDALAKHFDTRFGRLTTAMITVAGVLVAMMGLMTTVLMN